MRKSLARVVVGGEAVWLEVGWAWILCLIQMRARAAFCGLAQSIWKPWPAKHATAPGDVQQARWSDDPALPAVLVPDRVLEGLTASPRSAAGVGTCRLCCRCLLCRKRCRSALRPSGTRDGSDLHTVPSREKSLRFPWCKSTRLKAILFLALVCCCALLAVVWQRRLLLDDSRSLSTPKHAARECDEGHCLISGRCWNQGDRNPADRCQA
eukprot:COSAG01_NODE_23442_length_815_cov_1.081006_2_plen_209_part_01